MYRNITPVCPQCLSENIEFLNDKEFKCLDCGWNYFHNVAAAVGLLLLYEDKLVVLKRAKNPGKGKLTFPGGFVDPGESLEKAAIRECLEETGLYPENLSYLGSFPNEYAYKSIRYHTCDVFFTATLNVFDPIFQSDEVEKIELVNPTGLAESKFAFSSAADALRLYCTQFKCP